MTPIDFKVQPFKAKTAVGLHQVLSGAAYNSPILDVYQRDNSVTRDTFAHPTGYPHADSEHFHGQFNAFDALLTMIGQVATVTRTRI